MAVVSDLTSLDGVDTLVDLDMTTILTDELPVADDVPVGRAGRSHHSIVLSRRIIS